MKNKIYTFLLIGTLAFLVFSSFKLQEQLNFNTEVIEVSDEKIDIEVNITEGEPEFTYSVWENEPWENGKEIKNSGKTDKTKYTFKGLSKNAYFVIVTDNNGLRRVKQIQLRGIE